jgi:hypothetical protein
VIGTWLSKASIGGLVGVLALATFPLGPAD